MRRLIALATASVAFAAGTLVGLTVVGGPARAVVPGTNGRILFARCIAPYKCFDPSSTVPVWEIVAANPDDTNETVLAGPYPRSVWDDHFIANWAPDGKTAIFMADLGQGQAIWQVNADGSNLHRVWSPPPDGSGIDDGPTFTPDGNYIIFTRCCPKDSGYALWRINADGTGLRKVTTEIVPPGVDGPSDNLPQVSPNGTLIAFHRNVVTCQDPSDCGNRIVTVNINGGNRVQLTDPGLEAQIPNWSPDGKKIVFEMFPQVNGQFTANIATVNTDGSGFTQLTFEAAGRGASLDPSWSPDGTKIVFRHCPSTGFCDLFTMNHDGSGVTQITKTAAGEFWPQWAVAS
jgi:Tol biopolymer transport system component